MTKKEIFKGYFFSLLATLAFSNVYIFSKAALQEIELAQFGVYWFGLAILFNLVYIFFTKKYKKISELSSKCLKIIALIGLIEIISTSFFFSGINAMENPAIASFLGNTGPIFITIMGVSFLSERFNFVEVLGIILILFGAFVISYNQNTAFEDFFVAGTWFIILSALFGAFSAIIAKKYIQKIEPVFLSINRSLYLFIFANIVLLSMNQTYTIPVSAVKNLVLGSVLGPFLAVLTSLIALKYIEASRSSIIQSSKGVFVLLGAYLYFDILAEGYQILGGLITIIGFIVIVLGKKMLAKVQKNRA